MSVAVAWDPAKHPRDARGRWAHVPGVSVRGVYASFPSEGGPKQVGFVPDYPMQQQVDLRSEDRWKADVATAEHGILNGLDTIDEVNAMPPEMADDPPVLKGMSSSEMRFFNVGSAYAATFIDDNGTVTSVKVDGNPWGLSGAEHCFIHENGHALDYTLARRHKMRGHSVISNATLDNPTPRASSKKALKAWKDVRKALLDSYEIKRIQSKGRDPGLVDDPRGLEGMVSYLLDPSEMFARAYHQFVATKTGKDAEPAFAGVNEDPFKLPRTWGAKSFEPIMAAMENALTVEGLM